MLVTHAHAHSGIGDRQGDRQTFRCMCLPRLQLQHMTRWGLRKDSLLVLLLLLFVVRAPAPVTAQAAARKVNVSSSSELMAALQSDADVLVLHNDVAVGPEFEQFEEAPLSLQRCAESPASCPFAVHMYAWERHLGSCMVTVISMLSSWQW